MKTASKISILLVAIAASISAACSCNSNSSTLPPPTVVRPGGDDAEKMEQIYDFVQSYQLSYIRSLQLPSGAIKDNDSQTSKITPYFAHFAVLALLTDPSEENLAVVKNYMSWYFSRLNGTVTEFRDDETAGSVYDYWAPGETSQGTYDSVDSYAATFLEAAMKFAQISSSGRSWLQENADKLSLVLSAMLATIDTEETALPGSDQDDYLSIAHYRYPVKYLMDNTEVNMGLKAAIWLQENNLVTSDADLENILDRNTEAIKTLYNAGNQNYDYAKGNSSDWSVFYPGATAQLYPCLFGVVSPLETRSRQLYDTFNENYPDWSTGTTYDAYPWTMVAYAAAVMNDSERVDSYVMHIYELNAKDEQKGYWYDAEAGSLVLAIDTIRKNQE